MTLWFKRFGKRPISFTNTGGRSIYALIDERYSRILGKLAYSGILFCGQCKAALVATTGTGKKGKLYHYYSCSTTHKGGGCPRIRLNATEFDDALTGFLAERFFGEHGVERIFSSLIAFVEEHDADVARQRGAIAAQVSEVESRISRIYDALESGTGFDPDDLAPRIAQLRKSQQELKEKAEGLMVLSKPEGSTGARERLKAFLKGVLRDCGVETRVSILRGMGVRVSVWEDRIEIKANPALILSSQGSDGTGFAGSFKWRAKAQRQANTLPAEYTGRDTLARESHSGARRSFGPLYIGIWKKGFYFSEFQKGVSVRD